MHAVMKEKAKKEPKAAKRGKKTPHHTRKKRPTHLIKAVTTPV
jgi:hypothetical protein